MKNKIKYCNDIVNIVMDGYSVALKDGNIKPCEEMNCDDCGFNRKNQEPCHVRRKNWLNSEYKNPYEITPVELELLKLFNEHCYDYIARDKHGGIELFGYEPLKVNGHWTFRDLYEAEKHEVCSESISLFLFEFVKTEHEKAIPITKILGNYKLVKKNQ